MDLQTYQDQRKQFAFYSGSETIDDLTYTVLALCGEAGELANKLKKYHRSRTTPDKLVLADELGDVFWYVAAVATELGMTLDEVAEMNLAKLAARKANDVITG